MFARQYEHPFTVRISAPSASRRFVDVEANVLFTFTFHDRDDRPEILAMEYGVFLAGRWHRASDDLNDMLIDVFGEPECIALAKSLIAEEYDEGEEYDWADHKYRMAREAAE